MITSRIAAWSPCLSHTHAHLPPWQLREQEQHSPSAAESEICSRFPCKELSWWPWAVGWHSVICPEPHWAVFCSLAKNGSLVASWAGWKEKGWDSSLLASLSWLSEVPWVKLRVAECRVRTAGSTRDANSAEWALQMLWNPSVLPGLFCSVTLRRPKVLWVCLSDRDGNWNIFWVLESTGLLLWPSDLAWNESFRPEWDLVSWVGRRKSLCRGDSGALCVQITWAVWRMNPQKRSYCFFVFAPEKI